MITELNTCNISSFASPKLRAWAYGWMLSLQDALVMLQTQDLSESVAHAALPGNKSQKEYTSALLKSPPLNPSNAQNEQTGVSNQPNTRNHFQGLQVGSRIVPISKSPKRSKKQLPRTQKDPARGFARKQEFPLRKTNLKECIQIRWVSEAATIWQDHDIEDTWGRATHPQP